MSGKLSRVRLYLMRSAYLFNAVVIGFGAWSELTNQRRLINWRKALGPYLWHCLQPLRSLCTADAFGCAIPCANAALVVATNNLQNDLADRRWLSVVVSRALEPNGNRVDQIFRKHRCFGSHRHSLAVCV